MYLIPYGFLYEEQAHRETRSLRAQGRKDLPDDEFGLLDMYCPDPECDCQLVLFSVASRKLGQTEAYISLGFAHDDDLQPELDPYGPRPPYAEALLHLIGNHINSDPDYVDQLKAHYRQVKAVASDPQHPAHPRLNAWLNEIAEASEPPPERKKPRQRKASQNQASVPKAMQPGYAEITRQTDGFCQAHLDEECAELAQRMAAALARKRPSPLDRGKNNIWACGILYALAQVNFLFDKTQPVHTNPDELCDWFAASKSTAGSKARQIRDLMKIGIMDPKWCLPQLVEQNPLVWLVEIDGLVVDIRDMPRELQEEADRQGIIPYIPAEKKQE